MVFAALAGMMSLNASELMSGFGLLLDSALKGSLLVAAAAIAAYLLRSRSAAARHAAWTAAVVGHLALPALTLLAPSWRLPFLPAPPWLAATAPAAPRPDAGPGSVVVRTPSSSTSPEPGTVSGTSGSPTSPTTGTIAPVAAAQDVGVQSNRNTTGTGSFLSRNGFLSLRGLPLLAALWFAGSLLVLLRLALGTVRVGRLARQGSRVIDGAWLSLAQRVAGRLGINRPLTLLHGDRLGIPVTWGIVYPAVLLPPDAHEWPEARRRFVLVHEMAHVKRFDALTQLAAQLAVAIFWFDPLIWLAAHRMRVEREHACDDYVLRDGTTPSLYAGELLEMVRSLGTPAHERAAPAFAALAMARRSEFEGRMLAILDPKLDRHTLDRRSTVLTGALVALLVLPLAALRPFEQPGRAPVPGSRPPRGVAASVSTAQSLVANRSCESADISSTSTTTSTHISAREDADSATDSLSFMMSRAGRCTEASLNAIAQLSNDETRLVGLPAGAVATFRELLPDTDRSVVIVPGANGSLEYTARLNGQLVDFDTTMKSWLATVLPEVMRESATGVDKRVSRLRKQGGVPAVIAEIARIRSTAAKTAHYKSLLKMGSFTQREIDRIARVAGQDLASSPSDLTAVIDLMSRRGRIGSPSRSARAAVGQSVQAAVKKATSSGDKAAILSQYAVTDDPDAILLVLRGARELTSDGDKSSLLKIVAPKALVRKNAVLRRAFFDAVASLSSDGDTRDVLVEALPYGHADPGVTAGIISAVSKISSSLDKAEVLIALVDQRLLVSSVREAFFAAAKQISSSVDYQRVLAAAVGR